MTRSVVPTSSVRLYVILARRSPFAVVFRRGPSRQVLLLAWNTSTDKITPGQWLKGRIYERRCDLSPSGERLIYFAAKHRPPLGTWTAVSRPPYLTALALWPKGDAWGGGGLFANESTIQLNHPAYQRAATPESLIPKTITVEPFGSKPGSGEDDPIHSTRLMRDGWVVTDPGAAQPYAFKEQMRWTYSAHQIWRKSRGPWTIEMSLLGVSERDGPWYVLEHRLLDAGGAVAMDFGRSDWADWSREGDLLLAQNGRLYRLAVQKDQVDEPGEVMDLRSLRFENVQAPSEATQWRGRLRLR